MFELLRKFSLFMILFVVGMGTYLSTQNSTDWREPLRVQMYRINGDGLESTDKYIQGLDKNDYVSIEEFMKREASRYKVDINQPVEVINGSIIAEQPPAPPANAGPFSIGMWSLKLRWWARQITRNDVGPSPDIRLFLVYFDPIQRSTLSHSLGLQKGLIGIVNVFASRNQQLTNNFVIAHEMLHTLGATDKYGGPQNLPIFPDGYANPDVYPLYPQKKAELMGGRIAISKTEAEIPAGLEQVSIGIATAQEIRWVD